MRRWNINQALRESGRTASSTAGSSRLRSILVVCQISAVVVLIVVSALLIRSFVALQNVDPGFRSDRILSVHFALSVRYGSNPRFGQYLKRIVDRVSVLPGVASVGSVNRLPLAEEPRPARWNSSQTRQLKIPQPSRLAHTSTGERPHRIIFERWESRLLRQGAVFAGLGTLIGLAGSLTLGRILSTLLYEIKPTDLVSLVSASLLILIIVAVASLIPARRAASVDPLSVLRAE